MKCARDTHKYQLFQSTIGFSLLDLLIALMVLVIVLLAAVNQFNIYNEPATQVAPQAQPAPSPSQQQ